MTESKHFAAFIPDAALSPFHAWILPRRHVSFFDAATDEELSDLAGMPRGMPGKPCHGPRDPDDTYSIRTAPTREGHTEYFHWYLTIIPRLDGTEGFEIGSGMRINSPRPEECAAYLRSAHGS